MSNKKTIEDILKNTEFVNPKDLIKQEINEKSDNCDADDENIGPDISFEQAIQQAVIQNMLEEELNSLSGDFDDDSEEPDDEMQKVSFIMDQIIHFAKCISIKKYGDREKLEVWMMDSETRTKKISPLFVIDRPLKPQKHISCNGAKIKASTNIGNLCFAIIDLHLPRMCMACQAMYWEKGLVWKQVIDREMNDIRRK